MPASDIETIQALRRDLALQIARFVSRWELNQVAAARQLGIPQPTLSRIVNGRVSKLSLELLIRIAVRAGLPVVLQTGKEPAEAGAFVAGGIATRHARSKSKVADEAREAVLETARRLTPEQRLETFLEHNELTTALHRAGRRAAGAALTHTIRKPSR